jgi:hypothetical protein
MCTVLLPPGVNPIAISKYISINLALLGSEAAHGRFSESHVLLPTLKRSSVPQFLAARNSGTWANSVRTTVNKFPLNTWYSVVQQMPAVWPPLSSSKEPFDYGRLLDLHALILYILSSHLMLGLPSCRFSFVLRFSALQHRATCLVNRNRRRSILSSSKSVV